MRTPVDLNGKLKLHPRCAVSVTRVGLEGVSVIVVDDFLDDPNVLVDDAAASTGFDSVSDSFYPGSRAPISAIYCFAVRAFLGKFIAGTFGLSENAVSGELAHYSMVTTPPDRLSHLQRMPHIDNTSPKQIAVLHYLCKPEHGGTSFYRHRRTQYEFVDESRAARYKQCVAEDVARSGTAPAGYICGDDAMFERTASFGAAFNRVLIYRSFNLHSADIGAGHRFDPNPRSGRLTANSFFYYR